MARKRKKWQTEAGARRIKHTSEKAAYEQVKQNVKDWAAGTLKPAWTTVWLDEGDSPGWQRYEEINHEEWAATS
jgi:hypothetical protein